MAATFSTIYSKNNKKNKRRRKKSIKRSSLKKCERHLKNRLARTAAHTRLSENIPIRVHIQERIKRPRVVHDIILVSSYLKLFRFTLLHVFFLYLCLCYVLFPLRLLPKVLLRSKYSFTINK